MSLFHLFGGHEFDLDPVRVFNEQRVIIFIAVRIGVSVVIENRNMVLGAMHLEFVHHAARRDLKREMIEPNAATMIIAFTMLFLHLYEGQVGILVICDSKAAFPTGGYIVANLLQNA